MVRTFVLIRISVDTLGTGRSVVERQEIAYNQAMDQLKPEVKPELPAPDMERLAAEVQRHQENPENRQTSGQELIKKSLHSLSPQPAASAASPTDDDKFLPNYVQSAPAPTKAEVEHLLTLVFQEGLAKAQREALKSSAFVLDAFHDALAGKLYPELQKRGIVK